MGEGEIAGVPVVAGRVVGVPGIEHRGFREQIRSRLSESLMEPEKYITRLRMTTKKYRLNKVISAVERDGKK